MVTEKRLLNYRKRIDKLLLRDDLDWQQLMEEHLVQISFFQHERLVHLLVTITFAILEMMAVGLSVFSFSLGIGLLAVLLLVLLIPYVRHYYVLENEVQKMYEQYDRMVEKTGKAVTIEKF